MKRIVHGLVATLLVASGANAKNYTDHNFLAQRSELTNIAMEYTTWHKQTARIDEDKWGGSVQATGFYQESDNKKDLGKYFGVTNYYNGNSVDDFINVAPAHDTTLAADDDLIHLYDLDIFHVAGATNATPDRILQDKLILRPHYESYGVRLDYHQKLDKVLDGLFFKISTAVVNVETSLGFYSTGHGVKQGLTKGLLADPANHPDLTGASKSVIDYLTGNVVNNDANNKQASLAKGKFHNDQSTTELADIDLMIGYNFLYKPTKHINVTFGVTFPTSDDPDGEYLFEPTTGNRGHWAVGGGMDMAFQMWKKHDWTIDFLCAFNYRYLLENSEMRMPQIKSNTTTSAYPNPSLFGQYALAGKLGNPANSALFPLANVLMQKVEVTPGHHFDGMLEFAVNYGNFTFDLGYNLFAKARENVEIKYWRSNAYATALWAFNTADPFTTGHNVIATDDLIVGSITNPSVVTHKIFAGLGYAANGWKYPVMVGLGGSYEFATDNSELELWALWLKLGLSF